MTIFEYMTEVGMNFWRSVPVSLLIGVGEWFALLFYAHSYAPGRFFEKRSLYLHALLLGCCLFLQFRHYHVLLHCLILLLLTTVYICLLTRCSWFNGVFAGSVFCLYLELGKSLCRDGLLASAMTRRFPSVEALTLNLVLFGLYLLFLALLCLLFSRRKRRLPDFPISTVQAVGLLFPLLLYLAVRSFQYDQVERLDEQAWLNYDLIQYAVALCALLVMRVTGDLLTAQQERSELLRRQMLTEQKQQQYELQRESIEFVNRRYHDLKHYLAGIEAILAEAGRSGKGDLRQAEEYIQTIRQEIDPYASIQRTGNAVMDVLLSQRIQECQSKGIRLLPYIDATRADRLSTLDLCALFGNAMDNAIEAAEALEEADRREIRIKIGVSDGFLLMRFHNYYEGERRAAGAGFLTTKADAPSHGFGLSSIASIAEKYGGTISAECTGQEFTLHVLIPLS